MAGRVSSHLPRVVLVRRAHVSIRRRLACVVACAVAVHVTLPMRWAVSSSSLSLSSSSSSSSFAFAFALAVVVPDGSAAFESHSRRTPQKFGARGFGSNLRRRRRSRRRSRTVGGSSAQSDGRCSSNEIDACIMPKMADTREPPAGRRRAVVGTTLRGGGRRACLASLLLGGGSGAAVAASGSPEQRAHFDSPPLPLTSNDGGGGSSFFDGGSWFSSSTITLPLEPASGGTFCVRCTVFASPPSPEEDTSRRRFFGAVDGGEYAEPFRVYKAIVDTGSPYLVLPSPTTEVGRDPSVPRLFGSLLRLPLFWSGAIRRRGRAAEMSSFALTDSEYSSTEEIYGAVKGRIDWKSARFSFRDPRLASAGPTAVVGVLDENLTIEATGGGTAEPYALIGLIRDANPRADRGRFPDPRPTFFEQERMRIFVGAGDRGNAAGGDTARHEKVRSFTVDGPRRELTLSTESLVPATSPAMPLVDLRPYGDFVDHYAVLVESVSFDGAAVTAKDLRKTSTPSTAAERPIVAVFDTGLTGCLLTRPFWDALRDVRSAGESSAGFQSVTVSVLEGKASFPKFLGSRSGDRIAQKRTAGTSAAPSPSRCEMRASAEESPRLFYVGPIDLDWFDDEDSSPYVIVLGQAFLGRGSLAIDMDGRRATFALDTSA